MTTVSRYTTDGWIEDLPELNVGRRGHGCGYFYNDDMQRVSITMQTSLDFNYVKPCLDLIQL